MDALYRFSADVVVLMHLAFIVFVVFGGLLALWRPRIAWFHVPAAVWGVVIEYAGFYCPLTPLEISLRERGGEAGYTGGFIDHYIMPVLYPPGLTRTHQFVIATGFLLLNAALYWRAVKVRRARRS